MARSVTEGVNEAVNMKTTGKGIPLVPLAVGASSNSAALAQKVKQIAIKVLQSSTGLNLPTGLVMTSDDLNARQGTSEFCGGSVAVPDDIDPNASLNFSMTFNNLCYDDGITVLVMNGVLGFAQTDTAFSISFTNFSTNISGNVETFTGTFTCDTSVFNCTISSDFAGSDGNIYRLEDVDINGDAISGYSVSAVFYHNELGQVSLTTITPITYGTCGLYPDGGEISIGSTDGSQMSVIFNSDCTFTIMDLMVAAHLAPIF